MTNKIAPMIMASSTEESTNSNACIVTDYE